MEAYTSPKKIERYAFLWLMLLLIFSTVAMFFGGQPFVLVIFGYSSGALHSLLDLSWILCGMAAAYLTYQWVKHDRKVFGKTEKKDVAAFMFMLLSGYNVGVTGLFDINPALSVNMSYFYVLILGALCAATAYHLWREWKRAGETLFFDVATTPTTPVADQEPSAEHTTQQHSDIKPAQVSGEKKI